MASNPYSRLDYCKTNFEQVRPFRKEREEAMFKKERGYWVDEENAFQTWLLYNLKRESGREVFE